MKIYRMCTSAQMPWATLLHHKVTVPSSNIKTNYKLSRIMKLFHLLVIVQNLPVFRESFIMDKVHTD